MNYKDTLLRQRDIIPLESLGINIAMIGAGAVGSWTALSLAKMGFLNLVVFDDDVISIENMNCQFYPITAIDKPKVDTLKKMVQDFTGQNISVFNMRYKGTSIMADITISAVDSMAVRKEIFDNTRSRWLIDPRMAAEKMLLYVVDMQNTKSRESYAKTLYTDADAVHEKCTAKSTIYCANVLSGLVAKAVKDIATGGNYAKFTDFNMVENSMLSFSNVRL